IDIKRAPSAMDCSIIHDGAQLGRHFLADPSRECRESFPVKVCFQTMSHRFMKKNARPPRAQNNRHWTGGRLAGSEQNDSLASRLARKERRGARLKEFQP